jgi:2-C-methyl-D-erythritol 4-phosphate cytidylyltransferase
MQIRVCALQSCPKEPICGSDVSKSLCDQNCWTSFLSWYNAKRLVPAAKLKHTIKHVDGDYAVQTIPRQQLIQVFTPQVFSYELLLNAYLEAYAAGFTGTDDASLLERLGIKVRYLLSSEFNLKVTDEADLFFASH